MEKSLVELEKAKQKKIKTLKVLTPIVRYGCLILSIICFVFALKNSVGNLIEIIKLLDNKSYTGEQLANNYNMLIEKYGVWNIGNGGAGFSIEFINIKRAVFGGLMATLFFLGVILLIASFVFGKWLLPMITNEIKENSQNKVNVAMLEMAEKVKNE